MSFHSAIIYGSERRAGREKHQDWLREFLFAVCLIILAQGISGCGSSGSGSSGGSGSNPSSTPVITSLSITAGTQGTPVTISGSAFGATQAAGSGTVTFGTTAAPVLSWSATSIQVDVPSGLSTGMVNVFVTVSGMASNNEPFLLNAGTSSACATGNESLLSGSYAYFLTGFVGTTGTPSARIGSFTANGAGKIQLASVNTSDGGEEDLNISTNGNVHHTILAAGSSYSIGPDNRGCLTLAYSDSTTNTFRFSVGTISSSVATRGHIIEFDDTTGAGSRGSGIFVQQTTNAFAVSGLAPNFAMGLEGFDPTGGHVAIGGTFALNAGSMTNGYFDYNDANNLLPFGSVGTNGTSFGHISTVVNSIPTGRATSSFTAGIISTTTYSFDLVFYIINANQMFAMTMDTLGVNTPLAAGRAIAAPSNVTAQSLNGNFILEATGVTGGAASVELDQLAFTSANSTMVESGWQYSLGTGFVNTLSTPKATTGITYAVSTQGRVTFGTGVNAVAYLTSPSTATDNIAAIVVGTDSSTYHGLIISQTTAGFAGNGQYFFGTTTPGDNAVINTSGVAGAGVASSTITVSGTQDQSQPSGLSSVTFAGVVFTFQSGTGLGTATDSSGDTFVAVGFGTGFIFVQENTTSTPKKAAAITIVQQ
jgi:hypothetical protein